MLEGGNRTEYRGKESYKRCDDGNLQAYVRPRPVSSLGRLWKFSSPGFRKDTIAGFFVVRFQEKSYNTLVERLHETQTESPYPV